MYIDAKGHTRTLFSKARANRLLLNYYILIIGTYE